MRSRKTDVDYSKGIAITSGVFVDDKTHIEVVRYPEGSDALAPLATVLTDGGGSAAALAALDRRRCSGIRSSSCARSSRSAGRRRRRSSW